MSLDKRKSIFGINFSLITLIFSVWAMAFTLLPVILPGFLVMRINVRKISLKGLSVL